MILSLLSLWIDLSLVLSPYFVTGLLSVRRTHSQGASEENDWSICNICVILILSPSTWIKMCLLHYLTSLTIFRGDIAQLVERRISNMGVKDLNILKNNISQRWFIVLNLRSTSG